MSCASLLATPEPALEFLRSLQRHLTHLTVRVETEKAAVKVIQVEIDSAKRALESRLTVKTRGDVLDHAKSVAIMFGVD